MLSTKQLRYTGVDHLVELATVDYMNKQPHALYVKLPPMKKKAEEAKKSGDDETAYIFYTRWLDTIEFIKSTIAYLQNKSHFTVNMSADQINEVKNILAELKTTLEARYRQRDKKKVEMEKMEVDIDTNLNPLIPSDVPPRLPETPTDDPSVNDVEDFISCKRLYQIIQRIDSRCLIIDIREQEDYEASRMECDYCVNIPSNLIAPGKTGFLYDKYLYHRDLNAFKLFNQRSSQYVDTVVLLDWDTVQSSLTPTNSLSVMKDILQHWDQGVKYNRIVILEGGYAEWLATYPAITTNPKVKVQRAKVPETDVVGNEILDQIEYPEWSNLDNEDSNKSSIKSKKEFNMIVDDADDADEAQTHKYVRFDKPNSFAKSKGETKENLERSLFFENGESLQRKKSNRTTQNDTVLRPIIDRSNKPIFPRSDSTVKATLTLMRQLNELIKEKEKLAQDILEYEHTLYLQQDNRTKGSGEEKYIKEDLKNLTAKLDDVQNAYLKTEEELNEYKKKTESVKFNSTEESEKDNLNLNLVWANKRLKDITTERKKLYEREKRRKESIKRNECEIYKEPLKSDGSPMSGGLERSYSSPNLLQLGDRKAPQVDRSSKPQPTTSRNQNGFINKDCAKSSHVTWGNREERMMPIHGTVHPGITGLKNLGNSCYMNSIIQCLSNTTHLAKYFTDNSYADDLNANNESNTQGGQVVEEVAQVIKALWRGQYKSISPHDLKVAVGQYKLQFESYEQQDSHEFLTFLLDWMHNDLKKESKVQIQMTLAEKEWDKAMGSQRSIISDLFFGQLRSTITCSYCTEASTTYETFNSLTMSLPHSNRCTLIDCIQKFVTGQKVVGWKCPKCQSPREAMKKFDFVKLAPIVVVHLNRFAESGGWLEKRNTAVDFPLTGFNLKPYLVAENSNNVRSYNYNLYAMSNHYGTMDGGHYTAFCKNATQNKWYKYDDQTVTEVSLSHVKSQNTSAYLLFYTSFPSAFI